MGAPYYTYQFLASTGNEPDLTVINQMATEGWRLVSFNGDTPSTGGQRQWVYVMEKMMSGPSVKQHKKRKS